MGGKKPKIKKGEEFKREENLAKNLVGGKNDSFGFWTLNYTVSEACKQVSIKVMNKKHEACEVGVRTKEGSALYEKDFIQMDEKIHFKKGEDHRRVKVVVIDDDNWAEDRDFTVELYNIVTNEAFTEIDTVTSILIIDDDKPGNLAFAQKKGQIRHVATNPVCEVEVSRTGGADGVV
jgi:hypothetical protein